MHTPVILLTTLEDDHESTEDAYREAIGQIESYLDDPDHTSKFWDYYSIGGRWSNLFVDWDLKQKYGKAVVKIFWKEFDERGLACNAFTPEEKAKQTEGILLLQKEFFPGYDGLIIAGDECDFDPLEYSCRPYTDVKGLVEEWMTSYNDKKEETIQKNCRDLINKTMSNSMTQLKENEDPKLFELGKDFPLYELGEYAYGNLASVSTVFNIERSKGNLYLPTPEEEKDYYAVVVDFHS